MRAREELHESMCNCGWRTPARGECESTDQLIDNFAHELAEKIRNEMPHESYAYVGGWEDAANLIDPEVSE